MSKEAVPEDPGVEVERVPVLGAEEVRMLQVGASQLVGGHGERRVAHALREHELGALVERPGRGGRVGAHQGVSARAGVAQRRGADGLLGAQGALFGDQGLDCEAALPRRREHHL